MNYKKSIWNTIAWLGVLWVLSWPVFASQKVNDNTKKIEIHTPNYQEEKLNTFLISVQKKYNLSETELEELKILINSKFQNIEEEYYLNWWSDSEWFAYLLITVLIFSFLARRSLFKSPKRKIKNTHKLSDSESSIITKSKLVWYSFEEINEKYIAWEDIKDLFNGYSEENILNMLILFENAKMDSNPVTIYRWAEPLFSNPANEELTWYLFEEIYEKYKIWEDPMELFYWYSIKELEKVKNALWWWKSYENAVFTLMSKDGKKHQVARHTEMCWPYTIRRWSKNVHKILASLEQSHSALTDSITDLMEHKDVYTSWHSNRVMVLCEKISEKIWYNEYQRWQIRIKAIVHDIGKRQVSDDVLKKPWTLNDLERIEINSHTGNWVLKALKKNWEDYTDGMPHHCFFYSPNWSWLLTFDWLINDCKEWNRVDPLDFNRLIWRNIPEAWRLISIWDVIDAISSRRVYSDKAWLTIEQLIDYLNVNLLECSGLVNNNWTIELNLNIWKETIIESEKKHSYCIEFNWKFYIPQIDSKIQFDPNLLTKIYDNWVLCDEIIQIIKNNDKEIIKEKVGEFMETIEKLEIKKRYYLTNIKEDNPIEDSLIFTEKEEEDLQRIKKVLLDIIQIKESYFHEEGE